MMEQNPKLRQYIHLPEDEDIGPEERFYQAREGRLEYNGREVLYLVAETTGITCCDGSYASRIETMNVIGYINRWKYKINEKGAAVSEIEPIEDKYTKQKIVEILQKPHISKLNYESEGVR